MRHEILYLTDIVEAADQIAEFLAGPKTDLPRKSPIFRYLRFKQMRAILLRPVEWFGIWRLAEASLGQSVLVWEQAVVRIETQMVAPLHCSGKKSATHFAGERTAGTGDSKKIQTWPPFPDRDRSR